MAFLAEAPRLETCSSSDRWPADSIEPWGRPPAAAGLRADLELLSAAQRWREGQEIGYGKVPALRSSLHGVR